MAQLQQYADGAAAVSFPGVSVWAWDGQRSTGLASGVASLRTHARLTPEHRFQIASITKPMVAALVLQLVEEGKLALSDPLEDWLPGLVPRGDDILVKHLLSHRSGLVEFFAAKGFQQLADGGQASPRSVVALSAREGLDFQPNRQAAYSNTNYVVLGLVIEEVTGASLEDNLRTRIFEPLDMSSASLDVGPFAGMPMAHGYVKHRDATNDDFSYAAAAGGAVMSAEDVGKFLLSLLSGRIIGEDLLAEMTIDRDGYLEPWDGYGYGLAHMQAGCGLAYGHTGLTGGYVGEAWMLKSLNRGVVVLANRAEGFGARGLVAPIVEAALCG